MNRALELKFIVHGLRTADALPRLEEFFGGSWDTHCNFDDASQARILFEEHDGDEYCRIVCFEDGSTQRCAVRTEFACDYFDPGVHVRGFFKGDYFCGNPIPYFSYDDVLELKKLVREIRIFGPERSHFEPHAFFEVLPPGYEVGEEVIERPSLIDLGHAVILAYPIGNAQWNWRPFHQFERDSRPRS